VPVTRWYIERTVWLIAGIVLLASTSLALLANPLWILGVTATGLVSISVSFTGFCPVGNVLYRIGFSPMLGSDKSKRWYFMQTDKWYLERRIYIAVGFNISVASMLILFWSHWVTLFTFFVGGAMVWFAARPKPPSVSRAKSPHGSPMTRSSFPARILPSRVSRRSP